MRGDAISCFFFFSSRRRHTRLTCDWSSDVCSSDLCNGLPGERGEPLQGGVEVVLDLGDARVDVPVEAVEIGRASCRERVEISVGAGSLKKKGTGTGRTQ